MTRDHLDRGERQVAILAPTRKDGEITQTLLASADVTSVICSTMEELVARVREGVAVVLLAEEMAAVDKSAALVGVLAQQPAWSDLPVLVLTRRGADSPEAADAVRTLGNVTLLERPIRVAALLSAVRSALRARERQYQIRGHLADRAQAETALLEADRRKDEFLATLGHELRNPLAPLLNGLQLLKLAGLTDARSLRACAVMERQVSQLVRLVDDLLELSRITRGLIEVRVEPLELGTVLRSAVETSRPIIEECGQTFTVDLGANPLPVAGDPVRLTQVFTNLLNNASKYTRRGGQIWLSVSVAGGWAEISVRDNGIGMLPQQFDAVFDMFMQVDRAKRLAQGGLGIGLTLVRSLVVMHGGTVSAKSPGLDQGSEFVVRLPMLAQVPRHIAVMGPPRPFPPRRVLIVDDNRDAAESLSTLLNILGAKASVAFSGREALDALDSVDPEVVLLDIGMPGMDGYEVAQQIRSNPAHAGVLLIALTGWGQDEDRARGARAGFNHHLVKPPDVDQLRALLTDAPPASSVRPVLSERPS